MKDIAHRQFEAASARVDGRRLRSIGRLDPVEILNDDRVCVIPGDAFKYMGSLRTFSAEWVTEAALGVDDGRGMIAKLAGDPERGSFLRPHRRQPPLVIISGDDPASGRADAADGALL